MDTRRRIIEAAIKEFARYGYEGASTRMITTKAGLQHTLVTHHFKNKEGLWRATMAHILSEYVGAFNARIQGLRGVDDVTKLKLISEDFIHFSAHNVSFHHLMAHAASVSSPQLDWLVKEYFQHTFSVRAQLIRSAQASGRYVAGDPYHLEYLFIGAVTRIFMLSGEVQKLTGRKPTDPKFVEEHTRLCLSLFFRETVDSRAPQA